MLKAGQVDEILRDADAKCDHISRAGIWGTLTYQEEDLVELVLLGQRGESSLALPVISTSGFIDHLLTINS